MHVGVDEAGQDDAAPGVEGLFGFIVPAPAQDEAAAESQGAVTEGLAEDVGQAAVGDQEIGRGPAEAWSISRLNISRSFMVGSGIQFSKRGGLASSSPFSVPVDLRTRPSPRSFSSTIRLCPSSISPFRSPKAKGSINSA